MVKAIDVYNLSKKFINYPSQRDRFIDMATCGKIKRGNDFWALKDINFSIPQGTTFGIIGQNGSGKSTLLSILAGVLQPSLGKIKVSGKVAAILELGSGFHYEFTGRENVYMYGAILGFSRKEINARFDKIIDFSQLHKFIDQPLRTYSSGMQARLAFSVMVHMAADVLIIDEALAVGDVLFQMICFRRIKELQQEGKTIVYVSHDLEAMRNLCDFSILLDEGKIIKEGESGTVANYYHALIMEREQKLREDLLLRRQDGANGTLMTFEKSKILSNSRGGIRFGTKGAALLNVTLTGTDGNSKNIFRVTDHAVLHMNILINRNIEDGFNASFIIRDKHNTVYATNGYWLGEHFSAVTEGEIVDINFNFKMNLGPGQYTISTVLQISYSEQEGEMLDWNNDVLAFEILHDRKFVGLAYLDAKVSRPKCNVVREEKKKV